MGRRKVRQLELTLPTWGGKRKGAGRKPKGPKAMMPRDARPILAARYPVHVTLKVVADVRSLRTKTKMKVIRGAFHAACKREGFRITDWSVQVDHVHLMLEADNNSAMARGMQSFTIRVAKRINSLLGRKGKVFADRYHARILRTPREVRNCLAYVLLNARHHGLRLPEGQPDPCSSWMHCDGWKAPLRLPEEAGPPSAAPPKTWLRKVGWRRHGLICCDEVPGGCR